MIRGVRSTGAAAGARTAGGAAAGDWAKGGWSDLVGGFAPPEVRATTRPMRVTSPTPPPATAGQNHFGRPARVAGSRAEVAPVTRARVAAKVLGWALATASELSHGARASITSSGVWNLSA